MAKAMKVARTTGKGGVKVTGVARSTASSSAAKAASASVLQGRLKAKALRESKKATNQAVSGMSGLVKATQDAELSYASKWMIDRPHMINFVACVMRNGTLETEYLKSTQVPDKHLNIGEVGHRVFPHGSTKWKSMRPAAAPGLLSKVLNIPDLPNWFKGESKLPLKVAMKALMFEVGVDGNTDIPNGHPYSAYTGPLTFLCRERSIHIKSKLAGTSKDTLEADSDWYSIPDIGQAVRANTAPKASSAWNINCSPILQLFLIIVIMYHLFVFFIFSWVLRVSIMSNLIKYSFIIKLNIKKTTNEGETITMIRNRGSANNNPCSCHLI
jgi:hypothetical protein